MVMDLTTFLAIVGASWVPVVGWAIRTHISIQNLNGKVDSLIEMQKASNSDNSGFKSVIEDNTRALNALTHYIRYLEVKRTGSEPPPPLEG